MFSFCLCLFVLSASVCDVCLCLCCLLLFVMYACVCDVCFCLWCMLLFVCDVCFWLWCLLPFDCDVCFCLWCLLLFVCDVCFRLFVMSASVCVCSLLCVKWLAEESSHCCVHRQKQLRSSLDSVTSSEQLRSTSLKHKHQKYENLSTKPLKTTFSTLCFLLVY